MTGDLTNITYPGRKNMSEFDEWYKDNSTSCDAKRSHIEGRIFALEWVLDQRDTDKIEAELDKMRKELKS